MALIMIRGGGDLASGVALRLHRAGLKILITELDHPLAVRRTVSFSEAVYEGKITIEGVTGRLVQPDQIPLTLIKNDVPVLIDPEAATLDDLRVSFSAVVDARMTKRPQERLLSHILLHVGLGPGFIAGENCDAVIETRRSHALGRVYWGGTSQPDTGQPDGDPLRVLRAPMDGAVIGYKQIGEHCKVGEAIAEIRASGAKEHGLSDINPNSQVISSPLKGVLRGLIRPGISVTRGMKIGDVDPRDDPAYCYLVSDKALAVGGGVVEALLTKPDVRRQLWD
jgi:xanthine dehydrogenase accessory factor